jgi:dynein heavy chain
MVLQLPPGKNVYQPLTGHHVVLHSSAELPESLKALFRPVSMVVPDLGLICEIMLMAEGFQISKILSRKFVILYKLCEDLLSKSKHYDWKLRAIKTTLYVAGGMKRAAPELTEDKVRSS